MGTDDKNLTVPFTWSTDLRSKLLPKDAPNPIVWCERCNKHHRYHTFTQEDYDSWVKAASKSLADSIDAKLEKELFEGE